MDEHEAQDTTGHKHMIKVITKHRTAGPTPQHVFAFNSLLLNFPWHG